MSVSPETDPDGVVGRDDETAEVHENTRESAQGVEEAPAAGTEGAAPATGLIGNGAGVDPRYVTQR